MALDRGSNVRHASHQPLSSTPAKKLLICANCRRNEYSLPSGLKMKRCSACKAVCYCSANCQVNHWKFHHEFCHEICERASIADGTVSREAYEILMQRFHDAYKNVLQTGAVYAVARRIEPKGPPHTRLFSIATMDKALSLSYIVFITLERRFSVSFVEAVGSNAFTIAAIEAKKLSEYATEQPEVAQTIAEGLSLHLEGRQKQIPEIFIFYLYEGFGRPSITRIHSPLTKGYFEYMDPIAHAKAVVMKAQGELFPMITIEDAD